MSKQQQTPPTGTTTEAVERFFTGYAAALLARDERAVALLYAVPGLIAFPGNVLAISSEQQTSEFFAQSWSQYDGVERAEFSADIMGEAPGSIWADVTWSYDGEIRERFCYQLLEAGSAHRIGVLTPMPL